MSRRQKANLLPEGQSLIEFAGAELLLLDDFSIVPVDIDFVRVGIAPKVERRAHLRCFWKSAVTVCRVSASLAGLSGR
jgi:hypothetical protein